MKRKIFLIAMIAGILLPSIVMAAITSVTNVTITPPAPTAPGASVQVNWTYTTDNAWNNPAYFIAVSDQQTLRNALTSGQWIAYGAAGTCSAPADPASAQVNGGCQGTMSHSGAAGPYSAGPISINLPNDLLEGNTYYVLVVMRDYNIYLNTAPTIEAQNFVSFTLPPPATSCSITKTAELTSVKPGDYVLYTIDYNYANSNSPTITDTVPLNCTLISQSVGGTNGGTAAGSGLTWTFANSTMRKTGKVWFIVQVNAGAPYSTPISNVAGWSVIDPNTLATLTGVSNDAVITTLAAPVPLVKSQSVSTANTGAPITYTLDFHSGGETFSSYDTFDSNISGFTAVSNPGPGITGTWTWTAEAGGGGYLFTPNQGTAPVPQYPHYLKNSSVPFCFGEIQADVQIIGGGGTTNWDGLITFRDSGVPDASVAYGVGISADGNPGDIYLQKSLPAYTLISGLQFTDIQYSAWYTIKILVTDAGNGAVRVRAKYWKRDSPEYSSWMIDSTDSIGSIPACGYVGFQSSPENPNLFDNLKIIRSNPSNVVAYDTVPAGITYVGGTAGDTTHGPATYSGGLVSWNIFTAFTDTTYSLTWWGTVTGCSDIYNKASLDSIESPPVDSNTTTLNMTCNSPTNSPTSSETPTFTPTFTRTPTPTGTFTRTATPTATRTNTPVLYPTLVITKISDINPASPGDTVVYTINYTNSGPVPATNVSIVDLMDTYLTFVSATAGGVHTGANPGGQVDWTIANIPSAGSGSVSFSAIVGTNVVKGMTIPNRASSTCLQSSTPVYSNQHILNLDIPALVLKPRVTVPNPASSYAEIVFNLTVAADVTIKIFTISGELIRTMEPADVAANLLHGQTNIRGGDTDATGNNYVNWDLKNKDGTDVSSGIYFFRVEAETAAAEKAFFISKLAVLR